MLYLKVNEAHFHPFGAEFQFTSCVLAVSEILFLIIHGATHILPFIGISRFFPLFYYGSDFALYAILFYYDERGGRLKSS